MAEATTTKPPEDPEQAEQKKKNEPRQYTIFRELTVDTSADDAIEKLKAELPPEATELVILVRAGRAVAHNAKEAVKMVANVRDLEGFYQVIADRSFNQVAPVTTKQERSVSIG